eukprot:NODE_34_length_36538_cov_0.612854.p31 type:complete len:115 gc:universal NODE_34_length_36538_cov_0.612854:29514-29170(-)
MIFTAIVTAQNLTALSPEVLSCVNGCQDSDVNCRAKCVGTPFPDAALVKKTSDCFQSCNGNLDCRNQCQQNYIDGIGVATNSSSSSNDNKSSDKKSSVSVLSVSATVFALLGLY